MTFWAKTQTIVKKILYRERLFEQKHKQWSTKYYSENDYLSKKKQWSTKYNTENDYLSKNTNNSQKNTIQRTTIWAKTQTMINKILFRKWLFEQKKQCSTKYNTENDYLSKNTNNGQQNTIQKTTIWAKTQTIVNKILYRKWLFEQKKPMVNQIQYRERLFEQKHKQWSTKYSTENDYLSKNTNNGQKNTIQKTTIWAKKQTMVNKILYRKWLFEQKHKQWSTKYYTENDYLSKKTNNGQQNTIQKMTIWAKKQTMVKKIL